MSPRPRKEPSSPAELVESATSDHWRDLRRFWSDTDPCWCQYWRLSSSEYRATPFRARRELLRKQLSGRVPPGVVAYVGGELAGWCGFWPRPMLERLNRSRTIPQIDDRPLWSIVCFKVKPGFRRRGVGRALLEGAVSTARAHGAPGLEAYPVDARDRRVHVTAAYVGVAGLFESLGFERIQQTEATSDRLPRWLMRLEFVA